MASAALPHLDRSSPARELWTALALGLLALGMYARTLGFDALEVGDAPLRERNSWSQALDGGGPGGALLWLEGAGENALLSRATALLLHAGTVALLHGALRRSGCGWMPSALTGALFAVHPLRVETIAWLSQRGALLGGLALAAGAWIQAGRSAGRRVAATGIQFLGLLAEPRLAPLALGCALLLPAPPAAARNRRAAWLAAGVLLLGAGAGLALRSWPEPPLAAGARILHAPLALGALALTWLFPAQLSWFHPHRALLAASFPGWLSFLGWLGLLVALLVLARLSRRAPLVVVGVTLFLSVSSLFVLLPSSEALFVEHGAYAAALGLELAFVSGAGEIGRRLRLSPRLGLVLGALLVAGLGARSLRRMGDWRDEQSLQESALRADPASYRAHDVLGLLHLARGRLSAAVRAHAACLALRPDDALALLHQGEIELRRALLPGQEAHLHSARELLERSVALPGAPARASARLGEVLLRAGDAERASAHLCDALVLDPRSSRSLELLGRARLELTDVAGAEQAFARAVELDPRSLDGWCGLGIARLQLDRQDSARACLERALALEPEHPEALSTLARVRELEGDPAGAEQGYLRAARVNPDALETLYQLGVLLARRQRVEEALRLLDRVVEKKAHPPHVRAHIESARLHLQRGERELARERLRAVLEYNPEQPDARALLEELERSSPGR